MRYPIPVLAWLALSLVAWPSVTHGEPTEAEKLFALKVQPLLAAKCLACHGTDADAREAALDLSSRAAMLAGGETSDEVLVPGKSAKSLLYLAVTWEHDYLMPPKEADRLTEEQTWWLRDWIDAGAPWPSDDQIAAIRQEYAEGVPVATSGGLSDDWTDRRYEPENLWAYQPIRDPAVPWDALGEAAAGASPIDAFLARRMTEQGVEPAPRAIRRELIRRVTFDLLGLPPTPEEVAEFVADPREDGVAFAALVDRLLASPHYGEQMARHWLDVVRYADTAGFANDFERPNAWRYRDYVIRSFQHDKPFDQFVREQISGDEIDPADPEMLVATGFLRMGPWEHTGMSVAKVTRQQFLDDVTDAVGQVFLAHPLQCAKCHDHKFDPVPTRDYYSIQAVFATTQFAERHAEFLPEESLVNTVDRKYLEERIDRYRKVLDEIQAKETAAAKAWYAKRKLEYAPRGQKLKAGVPEEKIAPRNIGLDVTDLGLERIARKYLSRHQWELDRYEPIAYSVYSGSTKLPRGIYGRTAMPDDPIAGGDVEKTAILAGGDPFSPTQPVAPGVLSVVSYTGKDGPPAELPKDVTGRREAFADWLADSDNPLTARVIVNRVWQWHFGQGLAGNANNFGAMGKKPTHPELLDWLATRFVESGWSIKSLHLLILVSDAYARSCQHPSRDRLLERDPNLETYAAFQMRRLAAEEIRDAMLAVSGELNPQAGGVPIRPEMNLEAALQPRQIMGTYAPAYQPSPLPEQRNRRTIYAQKVRGQRDPFLEVFDQPSPEESCERRQTSTITPQVFSLLNGKTVNDRALALAARLLRETESDRGAIERAFALCYGRPATPAEADACLAHWREMTQAQREIDWRPRGLPRKVTRRAVEEQSGATFAFTEELEVTEDYVPDLQPTDVSARTRALADVCLVLLNANEFLYIP